MWKGQSSPVKNPLTWVIPFDIAPSITERWEIDLSPGTVIVPFICFAGFITVFIRSFLYGYIIIHISKQFYAALSVLFGIKSKCEGAAVVFSAVDDAHVFDINTVTGEQNGNNSNAAGRSRTSTSIS